MVIGCPIATPVFLAASPEQLYDLLKDPYEERELIAAHNLLLPFAPPGTVATPAGGTPAGGTPASTLPPLGAAEARASAALAELRNAMQRDLAEISATCGVA